MNTLLKIDDRTIININNMTSIKLFKTENHIKFSFDKDNALLVSFSRKGQAKEEFDSIAEKFI